jgi:hypothetical protein
MTFIVIAGFTACCELHRRSDMKRKAAQTILVACAACINSPNVSTNEWFCPRCRTPASCDGLAMLSSLTWNLRPGRAEGSTTQRGIVRVPETGGETRAGCSLSLRAGQLVDFVAEWRRSSPIHALAGEPTPWLTSICRIMRNRSAAVPF